MNEKTFASCLSLHDEHEQPEQHKGQESGCHEINCLADKNIHLTHIHLFDGG